MTEETSDKIATSSEVDRMVAGEMMVADEMELTGVGTRAKTLGSVKMRVPATISIRKVEDDDGSCCGMEKPKCQLF
jgi:hypothetical protein